MDGTLIDSVPAVDRNWRRWAAEHGLPDAEDFQIQHGTPARTLIATLLPADQVEPAYERIHELELEDNEGVTILPGTRDALAVLPRSGRRSSRRARAPSRRRAWPRRASSRRRWSSPRTTSPAASPTRTPSSSARSAWA